MKKVSLLALISMTVLVEGCDNAAPVPEAHDYSCSAEQITLVQREVEVCLQTGYLSSYCFAEAKATLCTKVNEQDESGEEDRENED
jgi:entry exclusion lipoprotein TrbK